MFTYWISQKWTTILNTFKMFIKAYLSVINQHNTDDESHNKLKAQPLTSISTLIKHSALENKIWNRR